MNSTAQIATNREQKLLDVFHRHVAAFTSGNLDAVLGDFGEHSVVITPDGIFAGRERIRALYAGLLAEFGVIDRGDSPGLTIDALHVRDDMLFITWHAESRHHRFPFGTDTFIGDGDTFARQTISYSPLQARP